AGRGAGARWGSGGRRRGNGAEDLRGFQPLVDAVVEGRARVPDRAFAERLEERGPSSVDDDDSLVALLALASEVARRR
uniref:hypothetical protein n=1 Tax=Actinacidiphila rubida TaxID=310780 RepID=UPI001C402C58